MVPSLNNVLELPFGAKVACYVAKEHAFITWRWQRASPFPGPSLPFNVVCLRCQGTRPSSLGWQRARGSKLAL